MSKNDITFQILENYFNTLAKKKLGFPTSFLSKRLTDFNLESLGILPDSLADILINEVGDPFTESTSWKIEVKQYEAKIIKQLAAYYGLSDGEQHWRSPAVVTAGAQAGAWDES